MNQISVTLGKSWDAKNYSVRLDEAGEPVSIEATFYGYRGRLTYRPVKKDGDTWRRVERAMKAQTPQEPQ